MAACRRPADEFGSAVYDLLNIHGLFHDIKLRCVDLKKLIEGAANELANLQQVRVAAAAAVVVVARCGGVVGPRVGPPGHALRSSEHHVWCSCH